MPLVPFLELSWMPGLNVANGASVVLRLEPKMLGWKHRGKTGKTLLVETSIWQGWYGVTKFTVTKYWEIYLGWSFLEVSGNHDEYVGGVDYVEYVDCLPRKHQNGVVSVWNVVYCQQPIFEEVLSWLAFFNRGIEITTSKVKKWSSNMTS